MKFKVSKRIAGGAAYAFDEINKKVEALRKEGVSVIDFGVGDPQSPPSDEALKGLSISAQRRKTEGYPSYIGDGAFRKACSEYMKENFGVQVDPDKEICSNIGSKEAIFHFPLAFIDEGDLAICPTPGYPPFKTGTEFAGGKVYFTPLLESNDFLIDLDAIPEDVAKKAKIIWMNYPNSPTGVRAPKEWLQKLIAWARKYEIIIAADEGCYIDLYFGQKPHSILEFGKEGIIAFYSLSKRSNMTMFRVGFVAGDENLVSAFKKVKTNIDSGTPTFIQDVAALALKDQAFTEAMRKEYAEKRSVILKALAKRGFEPVKGDATFFLWQKAPKGLTGMDLAQKLVDIGIVATPGSVLSETTEGAVNAGKDYVRLALVPEMKDVKEAARRIEEDLKL